MVSFKGLFYPPNIMQCVNVLQACCTKVFQGALPIQLCCSDKFATRCDQNMKQEMAIHRYKIQNTRFTREAFIVIKREFTRYKMSGKYKYIYIYPISNQRRYLHTPLRECSQSLIKPNQ